MQKKFLKKNNGTKIIAHVSELAGVKSCDITSENFDILEIEKNPVRCGDKNSAEKMIKAVLNAKRNSESVGGEITIIIKNCAKYLGTPVFGKVEAELARGIMSCGAVRSFEYGIGKNAKSQVGSVQNTRKEGISGGLTTGDDIIIKVSVKPTPSISQKQIAKTPNGIIKDFVIGGRHDPTIPPRLVPVLESMVAMTLADFLLEPVDRMNQIFR